MLSEPILKTGMVISEEQMVRMMAEVMGVEVSEISPTANFSEYGVDSLYGIQFLREIEELLDREIDLRLLYDHPSIRQFAACLTQLPANLART